MACLACRSHGSIVVPGEGVEPSWAEARGILSPVRLPVSPPRRQVLLPHLDEGVERLADETADRKPWVGGSSAPSTRVSGCRLSRLSHFLIVWYEHPAFSAISLTESPADLRSCS